jgi:hypothetical protein
MGNEQDSIKEMLLEFKITSDEIVENTIPSTELYELHVGDEDIMGPFWRQTIQSQIEVGSPLFTPNIWIRNLGTQEWVALFQHPTFQRRKPTLVPNQEDLPPLEEDVVEEKEEEDSGPPILILARGHKIGPLSLSLLIKKVGLKEILVTDLISHDQGQTWSKIYEMPEFDRREIGNREGLPHLPSNKVFSGSKLEVIEDLSSDNSENDTVFNLVHLGKKQKEESTPVHSTPIQEKSSEGEVFNEKTVSLILIIISLIGIGYFVKAEFFKPKKRRYTSKSSKKSPKQRTARKASPPPPPEREQRPPALMGPPVPPRGNSASTISRDSRPNMPDRDNKKMNDKALIDDRNYYDEPKEDERYGDDPRDKKKSPKKGAKKTTAARSQANGNDTSQGAISEGDDLQAPPEEGMDEGRDIAEENPDDFNSGAALDEQNEDNFDQQDENIGGDEGAAPPMDDFGGEGGGDDQEVY